MAQIHALTPEGRLPSAAREHAAEIADEALGTIPERTAPIQRGADDGFAVTDQAGAQALAVTSDGAVMVGATEHREDKPGYRVMDQDGRIAFEVDAQGRTHIYDGDSSGGGAAPEIHVFVAAGQSNMVGFAQPAGGDLDPDDPRILQYGAHRRTLETATVPLDHPETRTGLSPATVFAREYLQTQPDHVSVLLVPVAWPGSGFNAGSGSGATWDDRQATEGVYDLYNESVTQTLEALAAAGPSASLRGILWHQGESDQWSTFEEYAAQLDRLITNYRSDLGDSRLPFVLGQMTQEGFQANDRKLVADAVHQDTIARHRYTGFAPSEPGWSSYNDVVHFGRIGAIGMGRAYVHAYYRALTNEPGGPQQAQNVVARFIDGSLHVSWDQQPRRVTEYRIEYRTDDGPWVVAGREYPMNITETITGLTGNSAEVAVTVVSDALETPQHFPTRTAHITW